MSGVRWRPLKSGLSAKEIERYVRRQEMDDAWQGFRDSAQSVSDSRRRYQPYHHKALKLGLLRNETDRYVRRQEMETASLRGTGFERVSKDSGCAFWLREKGPLRAVAEWCQKHRYDFRVEWFWGLLSLTGLMAYLCLAVGLLYLGFHPWSALFLGVPLLFVGWNLVRAIPERNQLIVRAIAKRKQLIESVWSADCDIRTKTGMTMIIVFRLSRRDELEFKLADCVELLAEGGITEIEFWSAFIAGCIRSYLPR